MNGGEAQRIRSCAELSAGDQIEAWHKGRLSHRGRVTQTVASMDLFWIVDARTGARRLLDVDALVIVRVPAPGTTPATGRSPAAGTMPAGVLFHAPDLRDAGRSCSG